MTLVKPKAETREAWQYTEPTCDMPAWVRACTVFQFNDCWLVRRSGRQALEYGEWLLRNLDGEPEWLTHDQMRKQYDEVVG
jgi:hypothetical protein